MELWHEGDYIGSVGDGTTFDVIKDYVENQWNQEEKEAHKQIKLWNLNNSFQFRAVALTYLVAFSGVCHHKFDYCT